MSPQTPTGSRTMRVVPVAPLHLEGILLEHLDGRLQVALTDMGLHRLAEALGDAHLRGHGRGDLGQPAFVGRQEAFEQRQAVLPRGLAIGGKGPVRGLDGRVDVGFGAGGHLRHLLLGGRVDHLDPAVRHGRVHPLAVDVHLGRMAHSATPPIRASIDPHSMFCDLATPGQVSTPPQVFTPAFREASSLKARAAPLPAMSST